MYHVILFFLRYKIYSNHLKQFESLTLTYFVSYIGKLLAWAHRSRLSVRLTLVNILFAINIYICLMSKTKSWYKVHYVERRVNIAAFVYRHTNINHHEGKCDNLHIIKVLFDHKNLLCKVTILKWFLIIISRRRFLVTVSIIAAVKNYIFLVIT